MKVEKIWTPQNFVQQTMQVQAEKHFLNFVEPKSVAPKTQILDFVPIVEQEAAPSQKLKTGYEC